MNVSANKEVTVTLTFNEREAKLLTCLLGATSPTDAEATIKRAIYYSEWLGKLKNTEVSDFTSTLYEALYELF